MLVLLYVMEHLGLSSHNNCRVLSPCCLCDALLIKFLFLQGPGSKPAWAGGRTVAPNCSPGQNELEWEVEVGALQLLSERSLWMCSSLWVTFLNSVIYLYCRKTILGDMRYKPTVKRFTSMDLLQTLNCISPEYFALAPRQLTVLAAPSVSHSRLHWSLFSCICPASTQPMSLHF